MRKFSTFILLSFAICILTSRGASGDAAISATTQPSDAAPTAASSPTTATASASVATSASAIVGAAAAVPAAAPARITPDPHSINPGIQSFTVVSDYQKGPNELEVLLPDDYSPNTRYRVVYLLPVNVGTSGPWGSGIVEARRLNLQNQYQLVFVAPAYDTLPWFGDNPLRPEIRQNGYLLDVVIPFIDSHFSTLASAKGRMLVGFSKSGLGAWSLFLMHPDLFDQVAIFDSFEGRPTNLQWTTWGFADTYGTRENFDRYDPMLLLDKQKTLLQHEPRRITLLGGGPGMRIGVDNYHAVLQNENIPFIYIQGSYMQHNWTSGWLPLAIAGMAYPPTTQPVGR
jgi:S-formylglutathione hydrolase FrmB